MARRKIEFPAKGKIRKTGDQVTILREGKTAGFHVYEVKDTDGAVRTYRTDAILVIR